MEQPNATKYALETKSRLRTVHSMFLVHFYLRNHRCLLRTSGHTLDTRVALINFSDKNSRRSGERAGHRAKYVSIATKPTITIRIQIFGNSMNARHGPWHVPLDHDLWHSAGASPRDFCLNGHKNFPGAAEIRVTAPFNGAHARVFRKFS